MFVLMLKDKKNIVLFIFFFVLTLIIYFESRYSGFVTDFIGFEQNYDNCGFLHYYSCSHGKNFRYLQHAFSFFLYKYIGSDTLIWYFLYAFAHALTSFLWFHVANKFLLFLHQKHHIFIAFVMAVLFLISPYQSEVVVWRVCIQYNTITICLLLSILLFLKDLESQNNKYPFYCGLLMVVGLLSIEQVVVMPYFILLIGLFYSIKNHSYNKLKRMVLLYFIPQHLLIGLYFVMSKLVYGVWVMHYGESAYNGFLSLKTISKVYEYFIKYFLLVRYWSHDYKIALFSFIEIPVVTIVLTILLVCMLLLSLKKFIKGSMYAGLLLLFVGLYIVSLFPIIQLYFSTLLLVENDRLGYLSSMFIFGIIVLLFSKFRFKFFIISAAILITVNLFFTLKTTHYWKRSTQIYNAYLENFDSYTSKNVYLLGVPDNYKGIWMMRMYGQNSGFKEALEYRLKKPYKGNMYDVIYFNQISFDDGMSVQKQNDSTLYVDFIHYGSWFWNQGVGASDYETPQFSVKIKEYGYTVTFKNFDKQQSVILYPNKLKWIPVKM
jgi:hypothetical protein